MSDSIQSGTCYAIARIIAVEVCAALDHSDYEVAALAARDAAYGVLAAADDSDYASGCHVAKLAALIARDKALEVAA
tara:strand:+ start:3030 stop:3260 length:231 start_codon:yes stop_codon:yes gene_type:complete